MIKTHSACPGRFQLLSLLEAQEALVAPVAHHSPFLVDLVAPEGPADPRWSHLEDPKSPRMERFII